MHTYTYGDSASVVLIQPVYDLSGIDEEAAAICAAAGRDICLTAVRVDSWNYDLSPWKAPAVFGRDPFGGGADSTLAAILDLCRDREKTYFIGGYSLAGLFALWASYRTDVFTGVAAASPSVWFPGFTDYMRDRRTHSRYVYLSLGDREEKAKDPLIASVGRCIREGHEILRSQGTDCLLEWNEGGHFKDAHLRTVRAFSWVLTKDGESV